MNRGTGTAVSIAAALSLISSGAEARTPPARIALTYDDLPALTLSDEQSYVDDITKRLLAGLKRHRLPATGFVIEGELEQLDRARQIAALQAWLDAGMDLGNHSYSHESPNDIGADAYVADIARGEPATKALLAGYGKAMRWYRFPYLETGETAAAKKTIADWLAAHHYRIAPVTMNADDWEFAEPYDDAILHGDEARKLAIRRQFLAYTEKMIVWYRKAAHALFGRDIAYVMLLHATRLEADCVDDFAAMLKRHGLRGVTLDEAMADPAYKTPDPYVGADGVDWMERWSDALHKNLPWESYSEVPKDIQQDYDRVDKDR